MTSTVWRIFDKGGPEKHIVPFIKDSDVTAHVPDPKCWCHPELTTLGNPDRRWTVFKHNDKASPILN